MNVMGPERVLMAGGGVSALAVLVLILGWVLVGFWAGLLGAIVVLVGAYVALQRVLAQAARTGGPRLANTPGAQAVRVDLSKLSGQQRDYMQRALDRKASIEPRGGRGGRPRHEARPGRCHRDLPELVNTVYELALKSQSVRAALESSGTMQQLI